MASKRSPTFCPECDEVIGATAGCATCQLLKPEPVPTPRRGELVEADDLRRAALEAGAIDAGELLDLADDIEAEGDPWDPTNEEYHADTSAVGSTMLKAFRESPGKFYGKYVAKTIRDDALGRPARMGSLLHARLEGLTLRYSEVAQRTNHNEYKALKREHGELACLKSEAQAIEGAMDALRRAETPQAKLARWLLIDCPARREASHRWLHPSGVECKVRWDVLPQIGQGLPGVEHCFVDTKFVNDSRLSVFTAISAKFDRHCQAAHYSLGYFDLRRAWPIVCYVVIGNEPPHPIKVCTMSESFIEIGLDQVQTDLAALAECRRTGKWHDEEEMEEAIIPELEPPHWLLRDYERKAGL